MIVETSAK